MGKRKKKEETTSEETSPTPRKPPAWPETVPVLTAEFVWNKGWSNLEGTAFGLLEWCNKTFNPDEHCDNPILDAVEKALRETLVSNIDGDTSGLGVLDMEALFDRERLAEIWSETMRCLGYDL